MTARSAAAVRIERSRSLLYQIMHSADDASWMKQPGLPCTLGDPEAYFPTKGGNDRAAKERALAACRGCPVIQECLAYALENGEEGIWGATGDAERKKMLRRRAKARAAK